MKLLSALAVGLLLAGPVSGQDLDKGLAAYETGDYATALQELLPLAEGGSDMVEQGSLVAQYHISLMYKNGYGVPKDKLAEFKWLARQSMDLSVYNQLKYIEGTSAFTAKDFDVAVHSFRLAADRGFAPAQAALCLMHKGGLSIPQDYVLAYMWCDIAASNGDENGSNWSAQIAREMTPADISEAQRRASACMASSYQDCGWN